MSKLTKFFSKRIHMKLSLKKHMKTVIFLALTLMQTTLYADDNTIEGYWLTKDDGTNHPSSIITIAKQSDNTLAGKITTIFHNANQNADQITCSQCDSNTKDGSYGLSKGQKVLGSYVTWGFSMQDSNNWVNGNIIKVKTGKKYSANLILNSKNKLDVHVNAGIFSKEIYWEKLTQQQVSNICKGNISSVTSTNTLQATCQ